jgi:hypothetical protein
MTMSFGCFLFGHDFGDAEVEREREEQGSEVITTTRERETCSRCGTQRVVSENTEVTTLETPADVVDDPAEETSPDSEPAPGVDEVGTTSSGGETAEHEEVGVPETEPKPERTAVDHATDPVTTGVDVETDDGVILDDTTEEPAVGEREPGQWPADPDDDDGDWSPDTELDSDARSPEVEATAEAVTVPSGEFHCPECGFSTPVESSSLREGDYCPECHRGSLAHRPEE